MALNSYPGFPSIGGADANLTYITVNNETSGLPNSSRLVQGSGITLTAGANTLTISANASGTGTVTSVAQTVPTSIMSIAGSPITTSGTLAISLTTQGSGLVWAGPSSGSAATPTFRNLTLTDLPSTSQVGQLLIANNQNSYSLNRLTEGSGVQITNGSGSITIASSGAQGGTVTSVGQTVPASIMSIAGSPVTTSGTLAISLTNQASTTFFAGPSGGADATPIFRTIVGNDIFNALSAGTNITLTNQASNILITSTGGLANYFGSGADGDVTVSSNTQLGDAVNDSGVVVANYNNLTINTGVILTTQARKRALLVYVKNNCTINGTLTMTTSGASGVSTSAINIDRIAPADTTYFSTESNQNTINTYTVVTTGGAGGTPGGAGGTSSSPGSAGNNGSTATNGTGGGGSAGGGGGGSASAGGNGGTGAAGTAFSGGPGGGGGGGAEAGSAGNVGGNAAVADGGGNGGNGGTSNAGGGGGGEGVPAGTNGTGGTGGTTASTGTGGTIILIVGGTLTVGASGTISSNGTPGGNGKVGGGANIGSGGGGAAGGGGRVIVLVKGAITQNGTVSANGGTGGTGGSGGGSNAGGNGGNGGAGAITGPSTIN